MYLELCIFWDIFTRAAPNFETLPSRVDIKCLVVCFFKFASSLLESLANVQASRCENIPGNCEFTANDSISQTLSKVHVWKQQQKCKSVWDLRMNSKHARAEIDTFLILIIRRAIIYLASNKTAAVQFIRRPGRPHPLFLT